MYNRTNKFKSVSKIRQEELQSSGFFPWSEISFYLCACLEHYYPRLVVRGVQKQFIWQEMLQRDLLVLLFMQKHGKEPIFRFEQK